MQLRSSLRLALLALVLLALAQPTTAVAEDAPFVGWSSLLPGLSLPYDVDSPNDCIAGRVQCVDKVIRQMTTRFEPLASSCDHDAIFALTYLRVTEEYRRTIETPTFFDDTSFVNHEDVLFARYYFAAYDAWAAERTASVPPAWRVAFDAARDRAVSANGNLLLGINAHVQRDLPFVLYSVGLVKPDGTSRKPDHDRVNQILNRVTDDVIAEVARRFDPTIDDTNLPTTPRRSRALPEHRELAGDRVAARRAPRAGADPGSARRRRSRDRGLRRIAGARDPDGHAVHATHGRALGARRLLRDPLGKLGAAARLST